MLSIQDVQIADSRLRFVYPDTVTSYSVAADTTFGDIAEKLCEVASRRCRTPIAIELTLGDSTLSLRQAAMIRRELVVSSGSPA